MQNTRAKQFCRAALHVVANNERTATRIIGYCYLVGDVLLASIPLVKNGFVQSLANGDPHTALLWQGLGARPLPVLVSALWIMASIAMTRGRFATSNVIAGASASLMIGDLAMNDEYWSIVPMAVGLTAAGFGASYRQLERTFGQSQSAFWRNTLGRPKQVTGTLFAATCYPLLGSAILDKNWALFATGVCWSAGSTIMMCLPREAPSTVSISTSGRPTHRP
jgi:hypothetical protein